MSLHPGELANLRGAFTSLQRATATVKRKMAVRDSSGGFTDTYVTHGTYSCSFSRYPIRPRDVPSAPRIQSQSAWYFSFPDGADIQLTDRLLVGTRTFEVLESGPRSTNLTLFVICMEII